jgi:hypothetical protein
MVSPAAHQPPDLVALEEYRSLREETLKRVDIRFQIFNYTLVAAGTLLGIGTAEKGIRSALLLYPILAFFFAVAFVNDSMMLVELGAYIRDELEGRKALALGWATHFKNKYRRIQVFEIISTYGLFLGTQAISLISFFQLQPVPSSSERVLVRVAIGAVALTFAVLLYPIVYHRYVLARGRAEER